MPLTRACRAACRAFGRTGAPTSERMTASAARFHLTPLPVLPVSFTTSPFSNTIKALNWYQKVRVKLDDPRYADWFIKFDGFSNTPYPGGQGLAQNNSYHVPACDFYNNGTAPRCSGFYHDQVRGASAWLEAARRRGASADESASRRVAVKRRQLTPSPSHPGTRLRRSKRRTTRAAASPTPSTASASSSVTAGPLTRAANTSLITARRPSSTGSRFATGSSTTCVMCAARLIRVQNSHVASFRPSRST